MKKKLLGILFVLGLLLALPSVVSLAATANGEPCGATDDDNVYWVLVDGTLTISGSGAMADYADASSVPWNSSIADIKTVTIENNVTNIGAYAFSDCTSLNSVIIPKSVTKIGSDAFKNCTRITVYYTGTKEEWDKVDYASCGANSLVFSFDYVANGGACGAKDNEANVKWVLDDNGTLTISGTGDMVDYDDESSAPWNVYSTEIKTVMIENGVTNVGKYAFSGCESLTSVTIPKSVTKIGDDTFKNCTNLTDVHYSGTKAQWDKVEGKDSLNSATLHYHCGATADDNVYWALVGGTLTISGSGNMRDYSITKLGEISSNYAKIRTAVIENGVTNVGACTFFGCVDLTSVTVPKSVTKVGTNAFGLCKSLTDVYYTGTKTEWNNVNGKGSLYSATLHYHCGATDDDNVYWALVDNTLIISGSGAMKNYVMKFIEAPWYSYRTTIKTVTIENGVTVIGKQAFYDCANLKSVTIPNSVTSIGDSAFQNCTNLTSVTIPDSVKTVNLYAFYSCAGLTTIYIPMHYDTESETYKKLDLSSVTIPKTATKLYYIAGAAEGSITPVTIDSVTYGTDKGNSITLTCGIMGNGYVIKSAKEGTNVTIEHKYSEIYTPVDENNLAVKCICSDVKTTIPGPVDPYANLVISETVTVGGSGNLPVTTIRGSQQGEDYTTVTVPKDVKYISAGAFSVNGNLDTIYLPEGCQMESESVPLTTKIVYYKVNKDESRNAVVRTSSTGEEITQVTVSGADVLNPDRELNLNNIYGKYEITAIADNALDNSGKNLHTVILPNSVESINAKVFGNCKNLETIYLKEGCTIENEGNIADKNLIYYTDDGATISSAKINIDNFQLELSQIRNGIGLKIGENAFKDQVKMKSVTIPATVTSIDAQAFAGCTKLTSIDIPASVTSIGTNPFAGCTGLQTITVNSGNTVYKSENGVLLSKDGKTLVCYPAGKTDSTYAIPGSVEVIAAQAFAGCTKLETITIPASVTSIGTNPFAGCTGLQTITVNTGNTVYKSENGVLLSESENKKTLVCYPAGNTGTTYTTPESVTAIAAQAFADCKKLKNVVLRENVTSVGADAFTGCDKLKAVYAQKDCDIDSTVLNSENIIYYIVTNEDVSSKKVTIGKTTEDYNDSLAGGQNCIINRAGTELDLNVLNNTGLYKITCIGAGAFYQEASKQHNLKRIIIPEGVTEVKGGFLRYSQGLESVKLPTTLEGTLPRYSITDNKVLKTLTIPHQVTNIDSEAFTATTGLETVYVPSTITDITPITNNSSTANIIYFNIPTAYGSKTSTPIEICIGGNSADSGNRDDLDGSCIINRNGSTVDLRMIDGNYKIKEIGTSAFSGWGNDGCAKNLKEIVIPEGVTDIAKEAFRFCGQLTSITLPTTLSKGLHRYFIADNENLKTLVVPHKIEAINSEAFTKVTGLTRVFLKNGFDRGNIFNNSPSAKFIRYEINADDPRKVKITDASEDVEVYCDEMGDRYVIADVAKKDGDKVKVDIKLKHRGDVEVPAIKATCEDDGKAAYWKCLCEANNYTGKDSEEIAGNLTIAKRHTSLSEVPEKAATFHACGVTRHYKCDRCGKLFSDETAAAELNDATILQHQVHNFGAYSHDCENQALHADVCALKGTVAATCAICDQTDVKSCAEHTKSSHVWTKGEKIPATCKTTGTQAYTCSLCNESETKTLEIDPNNHDYSIEVEGTAKEATCTAKGKEADKKCSRCEAVQTGKEIEIDPNNHTNVEKTEAKEATCTEAGNDEYWYCGGCKKYFEDKECTTAITDISKVTRPATGHDFESSTKYSYNSTQHWKKCSRCDEEDVNNKEEHKYSSVENKCDVCGYVTTPDTYTVSGTVYTWDNTDSNTTRVRLYSSTTSEADIKSDIQHDMTGESDTKKYKYDATVLVPEKVGNTNKYTQSFEFTGVANGEYKLAAWRPAYDISKKHYAYVVRITDVTVNGADVTVDENATKLWLYGDINGDGTIDAGDATNILAYIIKKSSLIDEDNKAIGDVNDDGTIDAGDATNVLAYIIGKSSIIDTKK